MRIQNSLVTLVFLWGCGWTEPTVNDNSIFVFFNRQAVIISYESHQFYFGSVANICEQDSIRLLLNVICHGDKNVVVKTERSMTPLEKVELSCLSSLPCKLIQQENVLDDGFVSNILEVWKARVEKNKKQEHVWDDDVKRVLGKDSVLIGK